MPKQIFCNVKAHDEQSTKVLLDHAVSLDLEDNMNILSIDGVVEKVSVTTCYKFPITYQSKHYRSRYLLYA